MELEIINEALGDRSDVQDIKVIDGTSFGKRDYQILVECNLVVLEQQVPIIIAIPTNWSSSLIDIYIQRNMDFPFIPHVDIKGKICLYELEGILIDPNLYGIITQSLNKARQIIEDGLLGINKEDFINEFDSYWMQLPHTRFAKCDISDCDQISIVKYSEKITSRRKGELDSKYLQRSKTQKIYLSREPQNLKKYYQKEQKFIIKNAMYIPLEVNEYLFPPDPRHKITREYAQKLLNLMDIKEYRAVMAKMSSNKLLIFSIKQPNGVVTLLGVMLEKCEISTDNEVCTLKSVNQIVPIYIDRIDKQYLMTRSNEIKNVLSEKKVLLIGCGSVGGYIANELVKAGIEKMMLVDADFLYEINIFRHLLGLEYVGQYKCVALQHYLEKNIPNLQLSSLAEEIEEAIQEGEVEFEKYDVIISATGNHNINRWINKFIYERKIDVPIIYVWNEALGIGNHVAYFKYGNAGCYECLFKRDDDSEELYDRTSYCEHGQDVVQKVAGCGSAFIPYGSTVSIKTAAMCVDTVKKIFEGRYGDNMIISAKGDDYHFKKAGLKVSTKYLNQKDCIVEYSGNLLANPDCETCGEKNGN